MLRYCCGRTRAYCEASAAGAGSGAAAPTPAWPAGRAGVDDDRWMLDAQRTEVMTHAQRKKRATNGTTRRVDYTCMQMV